MSNKQSASDDQQTTESNRVGRLEAKIESLEADNRRLEAALSRRRGWSRWRLKIALFLSRIGVKAFMGSQLVQATNEAWDAWERKLSGQDDEFPSKETRNFASALLARLIRVGTVGLVLAVLPTIVLVVQVFIMQGQNAIMRQQNRALLNQNETLQNQSIETQRSTNAQALSALIADLQSERDEAELHPDSAWTPSPPLLYRTVAVSEGLAPYVPGIHPSEIGWDTTRTSPERGLFLQALVAMEVDFPLNPSPTFVGAELSRTDLRESNLRGINLEEANLTEAVLTAADLRGARLFAAHLWQANLSGANLNHAMLGLAHLRRADLSDANLHGANLGKADLEEVNLSGADLTEAKLTAYDLLPAGSFVSVKLDSGLAKQLRGLDADVEVTEKDDQGWYVTRDTVSSEDSTSVDRPVLD
jgi:hypothetical protein